MFPIIHSACERGRYGQGCVQICDCEDDAQCDPVSGRCLCSSGKTGPRCDIGNRSRIFENTQPSNAYRISSVTSLSADVPSLLISDDELCNRDISEIYTLLLWWMHCTVFSSAYMWWWQSHTQSACSFNMDGRDEYFREISGRICLGDGFLRLRWKAAKAIMI